MTIEVQKILVLVVLAGVMLVMNLKAGYTWVAVFTFACMIGALLGAVWLAVDWVFLG